MAKREMKKGFPNSENGLHSVSDEISVREAGRRGGRATVESQETDFFKRIGRKGGKRTAELYADLLKEFGRRGGRPRRPPLHEHVGERERD